MKKILVRHFRIDSPNVDLPHNGLRILHLTDLHVKERTKLDFIYSIIEEYAPNFVALTGDYVCYDTDNLWRVTDFLRRIKIKKYATLGNHDHWTNASAVAEALTEGGCTVLLNSSVQEKINDREINIIGIDDKVTKNDKAKEACLSAITGNTSIILSHVGDVIEDLSDNKNAIILSGHTHAGQIKLPWLTKRLLHAYGLKYHYGFYEQNGHLVYVSSGLGESVPLRWRATPEICVFDLFNSPKLTYSLLNSGLIS